MRNFNSIDVPHFPHLSARSALISARDSLSNHSIEIAMTFAILFGLDLVGFLGRYSSLK
jgi:hypothetical protein